MSLTDDISKFCSDLILGDFEAEPGNAAMIVGGLVSLIPIADQVLDVRDMSGMIYRVSRKGAANCTKDDWVDLSLAAFGCIPELGSLFKTIVKPLWRRRNVLKGSMRGEAFISAMLGKAKGKAITFIKTLDWAGNTQLAIQQMDTALTSCDQLLGELEKSRWWVPDSLEGLARDLRPGLKSIRGPLHTGIQQGIEALRKFVTELIGEDGYRVAQMAVAAASSSSPASRRSGSQASRGSGGSAKKSQQSHPAAKERKPASRPAAPAENQQAKHKQQQDTNRQQAERGNGPTTNASRNTRLDWKKLDFGYKALIGEHMADYYHMSVHAAGAWKHGRVLGRHPDAIWTGNKRLVNANNKTDDDTTPTEIVPEHLSRTYSKGVDAIWSMGDKVFHFVEAKARESAGALYGMSQIDWKPKNKTNNNRKSKPQDNTDNQKIARKIAPPSDLTERQYALWCLLSQPPTKGLQMSLEWLRNSVPYSMRNNNTNNRFVYAFFMVESTSRPPKDYHLAAGGELKKRAAPGIIDHLTASTEVGIRFSSGADCYDLALHDKHRNHGFSDQFSHEEIDELDDAYQALKSPSSPEKKSPAGKPNKASKKPKLKI